MYTTEYDLMVAEGRARELRDQMQEIRRAQAIQATKADSASLLGRLVTLVSHSRHVRSGDQKVSAAA
jgi:hypothetical protein